MMSAPVTSLQSMSTGGVAFTPELYVRDASSRSPACTPGITPSCRLVTFLLEFTLRPAWRMARREGSLHRHITPSLPEPVGSISQDQSPVGLTTLKIAP